MFAISKRSPNQVSQLVELLIKKFVALNPNGGSFCVVFACFLRARVGFLW